ncbi:sialidase family protein [Pseudactinotalea sp.]|uniref:sialidase family protein n=1 Tax=Pseudactinotalea sp. TaxID=1926260 RepID=UPI003B3A825D
MEELRYDSVLRDRADGSAAAWLAPPGVENHASFLTYLRDGTLVCAWFAGAREARPDACIYTARLPRGASEWEPAVKASDDPDRSEQNPVLAELPDGRLWLLYTAQEFGSQDTALLKQQYSSDGGRTWSAPERFGESVGLFTRSPLIQRTATRWLLPVFHCPALPGRVWHGDGDYTSVLVTDDAGATWREIEVPGSVGAVHMCIVPMADGGLVAFYRSRWGDHVYRSESNDDGDTWTAPRPLTIPNGNSSIMACTVPDGAGGEVILLASNPVRGPEGGHLGDRPEVEEGYKVRAPGVAAPLDRHVSGSPHRLPLTIQVSRDRGLTWAQVYVLEDESTIHPSLETTPGRKKRELSYPAMVSDGTVVDLSYSYARRTIKHVRVPVATLARS